MIGSNKSITTRFWILRDLLCYLEDDWPTATG